MPTYFFHYNDGVDVVLDPEGRSFDSHTEVVAAALKEARSQVSADALDGHIDMSCEIYVENEAGEKVHSLRFDEAVRISNA